MARQALNTQHSTSAGLSSRAERRTSRESIDHTRHEKARAAQNRNSLQPTITDRGWWDPRPRKSRSRSYENFPVSRLLSAALATNRVARKSRGLAGALLSCHYAKH